MTMFQAMVYGLVQGLGEFLPISSSAHLTLLPWVAGWEDPGLAFDVALHLGTLIALLVYFRRDLTRIARAFVTATIEGRLASDPDARIGWMVLLGSIPGAVLGVLLEHKAEDAFRTPLLIAATMTGLGLVLYLVDALAARARRFYDLRPVDALLIGLAQACAIVPGVSRSGSTITMARALKLDREAAARFSFLLAAPIVLGAALVKVPKLIHATGFTPELGLAIAVSAASGYLAIEVLLRYVRTRSYLPFVLYRVAFGAGVVALWYARGGH
jgi:undecaprenyl-diphosphatase